MVLSDSAPQPVEQSRTQGGGMFSGSKGAAELIHRGDAEGAEGISGSIDHDTV